MWVPCELCNVYANEGLGRPCNEHTYEKLYGVEDNNLRCEHKDDRQPLHPCPYKEDINNDSESLCSCCDWCKQQCAYDI